MGALGRLFRPRVGVTREPCDDSFTRAVHWGPVGWRPLGALHPSEQIGAYGDVVLTRRYMIEPGVQRRSLGYVPSGWMTPPGTGAPIWQLTVRPGNLPGAQRTGGRFGAPLTPFTAAQMRAQLVRAQVAQSGPASIAFTRALIAANSEAA